MFNNLGDRFKDIFKKSQRTGEIDGKQYEGCFEGSKTGIA